MEDIKKCIKIKLKNIGPYDNWDSSVKSIGYNPIKIGVFAKNGTGKSTIAKQIQYTYDQDTFESKKLIKNGTTQGDFLFEIKNNNNSVEKNTLKVSHYNSKNSSVKKEGSFIYYVFNKEYTKKNISKFEDDIKGFIVGEKKKNETEIENKVKKLEGDRSKIFSEIQNKIDKNKAILKDIGIRTNTKEFALLSFENLKYRNDFDNTLIENFESHKKAYLKFSKIDESTLETEILEVKEPSISLIDVMPSIDNQLNEIITISNTSKELKDRIDSNKDFIIKGVELSRSNDFKECPFCESEIDANKSPLDDYISYLKNQESILKSNIKSTISELKSISEELKSFRNDLLDKSNTLNTLSVSFPQLDRNLKCPKNNAVDDFKSIIQILEKKLNNVIYEASNSDFIKIDSCHTNINISIKELKDFRISVNLVITKYNNIRLNYKKEITKLRKNLILCKCKELKEEVSDDINAYNTIEKDIYDLQIKLEGVKEKINKEKVVTETFSELIKAVFHDKFYFAKEASILKSSDNFEIDDADSFLSEGELKIISFLHYLSSVHTYVKNKTDYKNLFLVIDDPVTSVDFQYSYSICTIINNLKSHLNTISDLNFMIFTHNLEFMEILSSNRIIKDGFEMTPNKLIKLNKTFLPYFEHLRDIMMVSENSEKACHTTANSLRYILEYISKFENPLSKVENLINQNKELSECAFIKTYIHNESHGTFKKTESVSKEYVSDGCKSLMNFIGNKYPEQLKSIKK
ncbi:AAA family ATPase [Psychroflexus salis]|uniref:Protein CR006 P-loop domain-containing protein n=1 Tax=Psychroflexus salis TaxID=1526574 RepID=A0A917E568_9FLAO|nr:AAA family ATPase [Psychroflexus salis]GGE05377.1 hypothetical protein GCM10010831_03820 [Psychroflexus salis]